MRGVAFFTLGCRSNEFDTHFIAHQFQLKGYQVVDFDKADIYVINTCSVTAGAERSSRQAIYRAKRSNPNSLVVVTGCYAQINPQALSELKEVDLVVGNTHKRDILRIVEEYLSERKGKVYVDNVFRQNSVESFELITYFEKVRPFVKVQEGCNRFCSFCVIPFARGKSRSVPKEKVLKEAELLAERGFKEIVLTGTQLTQYGWDIATDLYELLKDLVKVRGIELIRLSSLYPSEISQKLLDFVLLEEKIAPHFHLPLQSGSDRILQLMRRDYSVKDYVHLVEKVIEKRPLSSVGTDVIVGFPSESDKDFEETYKLLSQLPIHYMHVFPYSDREGTKACKMSRKVSQRVKKERVKTLKSLDQQKRAEFLKKNEGKELRALVIEENMLLTENYLNLEREGYTSIGELVRVKV
ncbi:tRNA (N(6)-L-threonylcarbamoyladenosine(37)-C(2))-methylthiotransferase MtaB [Hydrogenobacter thermophilus]|uniref:tRNA (N(6)-L-threonylcarbamoyladenosine(37)-C(2))- methylthiotransferase MtaB n=1 Tax=Hydrogenobacter thermophilus TaxID=940 RepID=UPI0030F9ADB5